MAKNRHRWKIQLGATLATNPFFLNFFQGKISRGKLKGGCVPGLNCYSCPAAAASCPIGAIQAVIGSSRFHFAYYVVGFLLFIGVLLGRVVCGFLCPFGWFQELLHKIPTKKFSTKRFHILTYLKYVILVLFVVVLLASCGADRDDVRLLQQADSLLNVRPDSMKVVLGTWADSIGHCPERVRMYYNLLRVKADDKAYVTHTSDSLILSIVRYYREQRDKTHLPEALYYAGRTYSDLKDAPRALEYYQRAIDVMEHEELTDYNLLSRIYSQMGTLFFYQEL